MRRFNLIRHYDDKYGKFQSGRVADGVAFDDGTVVVRWLSEHRSTVVWESLAAFKAVSVFPPASTLEWID